MILRRRRGALEVLVMHVLFWWVNRLPGAAVVVCDHAFELRFRRLPTVYLACISDVVGETDAIDPNELFKIDVSGVGPVRVLEALDKECAVGI